MVWTISRVGGGQFEDGLLHLGGGFGPIGDGRLHLGSAHGPIGDGLLHLERERPRSRDAYIHRATALIPVGAKYEHREHLIGCTVAGAE
jgi:hypothetical protein